MILDSTVKEEGYTERLVKTIIATKTRRLAELIREEQGKNVMTKPKMITKTNLATYIASLTASATPYPIEITETETSDWTGSVRKSCPVCQIINTNAGKGVYIDLSKTGIPKGVVSMEFAFCGCTALVLPPHIPDGVDNLRYAFYNCSALDIKEALRINPIKINKGANQ